MKTVAERREAINEYVRSQPPYKIGYRLLNEEFGIPFELTDDGKGYLVNKVYMTEDDLKVYIKDFFECLDTRSIIELYDLIKA
jgi:hypothetical protein